MWLNKWLDKDMEDMFELLEENEKLLKKLSKNRKKLEDMKKHFLWQIK